MTAEPYRDMASKLGVDEETVLEHLRRLQASRIVSRVGPVFEPNRIGVSTLVAAKVPESRLMSVAAVINGYAEVNHNYEREHDYNLWFVVTAPHQDRLDRVLKDIEERTGIALLILPMVRNHFIDLGFSIPWEVLDGE
jgi:DNA-binding Lrp family transcriptional regulator